MKKKNQKKQIVDRCNSHKNNKAGLNDELKPRYTSEELFFLIAGLNNMQRPKDGSRIFLETKEVNSLLLIPKIKGAKF